MATKKNTAVGQTAPTPASAPATGSITLPEMPPAESFVGLVAYGVDTTTDESKHIPLEFLASGVQACIDATADAITKTAAAVAATEKADTATTGADDAAELARGEAENLSALKEAVANATADAVAKTVAAETATGAANTATTNANNATSDAIAKTEAAQTAAEEATAAKDAAIEATQNLTADVSALVLTDANKLRIQELAGDLRAWTEVYDIRYVYSIDEIGRSIKLTIDQVNKILGIDYSSGDEVATGHYCKSGNGVRKQIYTRQYRGTTPAYSFPGAVQYQLYMVLGYGVEQLIRCDAWLNKATAAPFSWSSSGASGEFAAYHYLDPSQADLRIATGTPYSIIAFYTKING